MKQYFGMLNQIEEYQVDDITENDVILDLGACLGGFSIKMASKVKHIIAVEPVFIDELKENIGLNNCQNVTCLPYALGNKDIEGEIGEINFCGRTEIVRYKSLKSILKSCPFPPTVLKTNCEGGEWAISQTEFSLFRIIEAEVHNYGGKNPMDFVAMLEREGFKVSWYRMPESQLMLHARKFQGESM